MEASAQTDGNYARIVLVGHFTFEAHRAFRAAYADIVSNPEIDRLDVDFAGVDYLDSSGLGMLLLLRERMAQRSVRLLNTHGPVRTVLEVANFSRLFDMPV
ncbi:STAS domain-containing protein [Chitinimonas sp. BJYL2]|uniref:STAS domain-containing protein n=1 Tax=Chitinimonas sp. BJYL2 TaxID=2976696 RepID=UPI0022B4EC3B|nr:STAS domain-containing protein [Chitinimonas sp. BJYL2]